MKYRSIWTRAQVVVGAMVLRKSNRRLYRVRFSLLSSREPRECIWVLYDVARSRVCVVAVRVYRRRRRCAPVQRNLSFVCLITRDT